MNTNNNQIIHLFIFHRKSEKRKWTLLVVEETEIDQYMFSIKHLTDLKPLMIRSVNHLDFIDYDVCTIFFYSEKNVINNLRFWFLVFLGNCYYGKPMFRNI